MHEVHISECILRIRIVMHNESARNMWRNIKYFGIELKITNRNLVILKIIFSKFCSEGKNCR